MSRQNSQVLIREARPADASALAALCFALWPESPLAEHAQEMEANLAGRARTTLPLIYLIAEGPDGTVVGFVETGLRSHADCCDPAQPVGFVEGWYVAPEFRRQGIGGQLVVAAEGWARGQGCKEMASDSLIDNALSQACHHALGYDVVSRAVNYRKPL